MLFITEAQTCIMGFLSTTSLCTSPNDICGTREIEGGGSPDSRARTRIIPEMNFTCSGTVTHWRAAGEFRTGGNAEINSVLSIWREKSGGTYDRVDGIELGRCGSGVQATLVTGMSNIYKCTLPESERVSVQPGDIVGIELPSDNRAKFRLYFDSSSSGPTNYVFNGHDSMFSLSQASSTRIQDQPQISLTVDRTTVPPSSTTETLSTDPATTQPLTEATSMAATGPAPTEALTMAMTTETQASTNITGAPKTTTMEMTITIESTADPTTTENTERNFPGTNGVTGQQSGSNVAAIAGAAVGGIIAVLLVLIVVLLLVLVLRRQNLNGQKFTPSNNSTIVNPVYDGKLIVLNLDRIIQIQ